MIASLFGTIKSLRSDNLVIDVNGVGYLVQVSIKTANQLSIGRDAQLYTSTVLREDSISLYGFNSDGDRELFELVQTVSGIGPKVALAITANMELADLASAISAKDESAIAAIPGIGKKSAQRMILELSGKVEITSKARPSTEVSWRQEILDALIGLGFTRRQSEQTINDLLLSNDPVQIANLSPAQRIKLALNSANTVKGTTRDTHQGRKS